MAHCLYTLYIPPNLVVCVIRISHLHWMLSGKRVAGSKTQEKFHAERSSISSLRRTIASYPIDRENPSPLQKIYQEGGGLSWCYVLIVRNGILVAELQFPLLFGEMHRLQLM